MQTQINNFIESKFSALLASFTKDHITQICMVSMIENCKNTLDKRRFVAAIFRNLSRTFDTLNHKLLAAKLGTYKLRKDTLTYMEKYLSNSLQRARVNSSSRFCRLTQNISISLQSKSILCRLKKIVFITKFWSMEFFYSQWGFPKGCSNSILLLKIIYFASSWNFAYMVGESEKYG